MTTEPSDADKIMANQEAMYRLMMEIKDSIGRLEDTLSFHNMEPKKKWRFWK